MSDVTNARADRCTTHHHACDCREYKFQERIQQLRRALDNIKIRSYELGQPELHDMALAALQPAEPSLFDIWTKMIEVLEPLETSDE